MINIDSTLKIREITLPTKVQIVKVMVFPVVMYKELDHKEGCVLENWCFLAMVLEKTLWSPFDSKIKPVNPEGTQPWIFIGWADADPPILWPPYTKSRIIGKDPWCWEILRAIGEGTQQWMSLLDGITDSKDMFEQTQGDSKVQGSLVCCNS